MISIIVEPDISHEGNITRIINGVRRAAENGAQFYKLQCYDVMDKLGRDWWHKKDFYRMRQVTNEHINEALEWCARYGIELICTVNDPDQVGRVHALGVRNVKLASGQVCRDIMNEVMKVGWKRVFVSTVMVGDEGLSVIHFDYEDALRERGEEVVLMHCVILYPPHDCEQNLMRVDTIFKKFVPPTEKWCVGYSDHSESGDLMPCGIAATLGAEYIELHVHGEGEWSPVEAHRYEDVRELRSLLNRIEVLMGDGLVTAQDREEESREKYKGRWVW